MQGNLRLIVCGGRNYSDRETIWTALDKLHGERGIAQVICGGAPGSDDHVSLWARKNLVPLTVILAEWQQHGQAAGLKRNQKMLALKPDAVVAFPGGAGTADMVRIAREAGLKVWEPTVEAEFDRPKIG